MSEEAAIMLAKEALTTSERALTFIEAHEKTCDERMQMIKTSTERLERQGEEGRQMIRDSVQTVHDRVTAVKTDVQKSVQKVLFAVLGLAFAIIGGIVVAMTNGIPTP
tara:strand:+ start:458 stop:781 length:324 start_codon:yes stop_codon:yes gene_type:complete